MQCGCNQMGLRGSDLCAEQGCLPVAVCVPASGTEEEERKKMRVMQASASESKVMYRWLAAAGCGDETKASFWSGTEMRVERRARLATLVMIIPARSEHSPGAVTTGGKKRDERLACSSIRHQNRWCRPGRGRAGELHSTRYITFRCCGTHSMILPFGSFSLL